MSPDIAATTASGIAQYSLRFSRNTALSIEREARRLFNWIATQPELAAALKAASAELNREHAALWRRTIATYHDQIQSKRKVAVTTYVEERGTLFRLLDELASLGLTAYCAWPQAPHNYHGSAKRRRSALEQAPLDVPADIIQSIESAAATLHGIDDGEVVRLVRALAGRVAPGVLRDDVAFAEVVLSESNKLIASIRAACEQEFLKWQRTFESGQALLKKSHRGAGLKVHKLVAGRCLSATDTAALAELFPEANESISRANMLAYIFRMHKRIAPNMEQLPRPLQPIYKQLGGREVLDAAFYLNRRGIAAAGLLYICDTGANPSTVSNLLLDYERPTDDANLVLVDSVKPRAGPEPIVKVLPIRDPSVHVTSVQSLRTVSHATRHRNVRARQSSSPLKVGEDDPNALLFYWSKLGPMQMMGPQLGLHLRKLLQEASLPNSVTMSGIRAAISIQHAAMPNSRGDLRSLGRTLSHVAPDSTSTPLYALFWPIRLLLVKKIRDYQRDYEVAAASGVTNALGAIGLQVSEQASITNKARRTGLGFLCSDPSTGPAPGGPQGESCSKVGACVTCHVRIFVPDLGKV